MNVYGTSNVGQLAEHRALLADDPLDVGRKPIGIGIAAVVMERDAKRRDRR